MPIPKPAPNEPCPCDSGKSYGDCHALSEHPYPFPNKPGLWFGKPTIRGYYVDEEASPIPQWLLGFAQQWVQQCSSSEATEGHTVHALMMIVTAGEAILNRLLEPLVSESMWPDIEKKGTASKWLRLSKELNLRPALNGGNGPLYDYLRVVELRNVLVHFKHGKNMRRFEQEFETTWTEGDVTVDLSVPKGKPATKAPEMDLRAALTPKLVKEHYEALRKLLLVVLDAHPDDQFHVVASLKEALG
jgi:hypothetical protein